jgi:hypothetical protein
VLMLYMTHLDPVLSLVSVHDLHLTIRIHIPGMLSHIVPCIEGLAWCL